jgi:hypothetical protein
MAIRLLSLTALGVGAALSALFYVMAPMAKAAGCTSAENCPELEFPLRLVQSSVPLGISIALVVLALLVHRKHQRFGRAILALPLLFIAVWVGGVFAASFLGR